MYHIEWLGKNKICNDFELELYEEALNFKKYLVSSSTEDAWWSPNHEDEDCDLENFGLRAIFTKSETSRNFELCVLLIYYWGFERITFIEVVIPILGTFPYFF